MFADPGTHPSQDPLLHLGFPFASFRAPVTGRCHYCGDPATSRDHIVPEARSGVSAWWNLVPACEDCNTRRGDELGWCECAFCKRAVRLWELGERRQGRSRSESRKAAALRKQNRARSQFRIPV